jgi:O-antigen/teichoic acid export membrane protein
MLLKAAKVGFIMGSASLCTFLSNVLIARWLDKPEMGTYSLIVSLVMLFGSISLLGRSNALARFFSKNPIGKYRWKSELSRFLPLCLAVILVLGIGVRYIYHLSFLYLSIITVSTLVFVFIQLISAGLLRSQKEYTLAVFSQKGFILLFVISLVVLKILGLSSLRHILIFYALSLLLFGFLNLGLILSRFSSGSEKIPPVFRNESYLFWGINISLIAIKTLDRLFIGKLISYDELAVYVAVFTVTGLYELVSMSLGYVLLPHFGRTRSIRLTKYIVQGFLLAVLISGVYLIWGEKIIHLVYSGRYDQGSPIIIFFILAGICKILYAIPSSMIGGRLDKKALRLTFFFNTSNVALHIGFLLWFISRWGLRGAALATFCIWLLRTLQGYFILYRNRDHFRPAPDPGEINASSPLTPEKLLPSS